jgi:hypothetical protein
LHHVAHSVVELGRRQLLSDHHAVARQQFVRLHLLVVFLDFQLVHFATHHHLQFPSLIHVVVRVRLVHGVVDDRVESVFWDYLVPVHRPLMPLRFKFQSLLQLLLKHVLVCGFGQPLALHVAWFFHEHVLLGVAFALTKLGAQALELLARDFIVSSEEIRKHPVVVIATEELLRGRHFEGLLTLNKVRVVDVFPGLVDILLVVVPFAARDVW